MSRELLSHPHLHLEQHIVQVGQAVNCLKKWHSCRLWEEHEDLINWAVRLHDLGKSNLYFQEYIRDPQGYKGSQQNKSHSPLSLLLTLTLGLMGLWDNLDALSLAISIRGHHSALPTLPEKRIGAVYLKERALDNFAGGETCRVLRKQLAALPLSDLAKTAGIEHLNEIIIPDEARIGTLIRKAKRYLDVIIERLFSLNEKEATHFRIRTQFVFSLLLEADKAFLALSDRTHYEKRNSRYWDPCWVEKRIDGREKSETNQLRQKIRNEVEENLEKNSNSMIFSLTAPTGCGKTLLAATWALRLRASFGKEGCYQKIIIVLPFLSVIEQTVKEYTALLRIGGVEKEGSWLLTCHSLAQGEYGSNLEEEQQRFFIDTWRSEMIITTYDQFLLTMMDPKVRYQMRFHNLCDALIILDEVQSLPCHLWKSLDCLLNGLAEFGNARVLLMSATLPSFVSGQVPLLNEYPIYFQAFNRYVLHLRLKQPVDIDAFSRELKERLTSWLENGRRVLVTLNTRGSARRILDALREDWPKEFNDIPLLFISADVTPKDRLRTIEVIKESKPCIVVSTQSIEAGVDIDMDEVIRDFAPLDSIVQIAGRCNREGRKPRGRVEIVDLLNENDRRYAEMIYEPVHLQVTRELLKDKETVAEEDILFYAEHFFHELSQRKDTGAEHIERFLSWEEDISIHELLRGKEKLQHTFLVIEQDPELKSEMEKTSQIQDRWERRESWRRLAARIASISVSVFARPDFKPQQIANEFMRDLWLLRPGYYSRECGLNIKGETLIL
jgi:CRISPR-associated endonuclease/helicase Cas3